jgi:hypothetical protein
VQRLLALTLGIYLNTLTGRPPRALAAYDEVVRVLVEV